MDQQEAQVAPAVRERGKLRLALAGVVLDIDLTDIEAELGCADHPLGGELHPGRPQVEPRQQVAAEGAHAAVGVGNARAEEEVEQAGQDRISDVAVQPRHGSLVDFREAVADHHVGALLERLQEARDLGEIVGVVGVTHEDVGAARGSEAGQVGGAVALARLVHDTRAGALGQLGRAVRRAVVGDHDLAGDAGLAHGPHRLADDDLDRIGLVEAGDHDRQGQRRPRHLPRLYLESCLRNHRFSVLAIA